MQLILIHVCQMVNTILCVGDEVRYVFNDALANYDPNNPATYHIINYRNWQKEIYTICFLSVIILCLLVVVQIKLLNLYLG